MNKMLTIFAVISLLSLRVAADAKAAASRFEWGSMTSEATELLGIPVNNPSGEMLGIIDALVNDSEGHVAFAILWRGPWDLNPARYVAVPFKALSISGKEPTQMTVVLNINKRTLDSAPSFDKTRDLNNADWAASIYRYFGQVPYWTEEEAGNAGSTTNSTEGGYDYP